MAPYIREKCSPYFLPEGITDHPQAQGHEKSQARRKLFMQFKEFSGDIYNVLSRLARATGGFIEANSKPAAVLKKTASK